MPFPSSWFQSANPIFVIMLTPLAAALWMKLGKHQPSSPVKFGLGLTFLAASFLLMVPAANYAADGRVSPFWLLGLYFLFTVVNHAEPRRAFDHDENRAAAHVGASARIVVCRPRSAISSRAISEARLRPAIRTHSRFHSSLKLGSWRLQRR